MTDLEIVREVLAGRKDLFADLVDRYQNLVFAAVYGSLHDGARETEDLAQEVFIKAYRALPQFRGEASFSTWLYNIAQNHLKDHCRRRRPTPIALEAAGEHHASACADPEEAAVAAENQAAIRQGLASLPGIYRQVLYLYHYHGLSYAEIGLRLGLPARTVETRLYRAKKLLKGKMDAGEVPAGCAGR